jgi:hypothetical protein
MSNKVLYKAQMSPLERYNYYYNKFNTACSKYSKEEDLQGLVKIQSKQLAVLKQITDRAVLNGCLEKQSAVNLQIRNIKQNPPPMSAAPHSDSIADLLRRTDEFLKKSSSLSLQNSVNPPETKKKISKGEYLNQLIPVKDLPMEITGEEQKQKYEENLSKTNKNRFANLWVPIPGRYTAQWSKEKIEEHWKQGFPIYMRLYHKEEKFYQYEIFSDAIFPSRLNENKENVYDPHKTQIEIIKYRTMALPEEIRFSKERDEKVAQLKKDNNVNKIEAFFQYAIEHNQSTVRKDFSLNDAMNRVYSHLLSSHAEAITHCSPFKGMLGGTIKDLSFVNEMKEVISSYTKDTKMLIIIDKYGRFIHNHLNPHQKKEFLALGGILQSEIVFEMDASQFNAFAEKLNQK